MWNGNLWCFCLRLQCLSPPDRETAAHEAISSPRPHGQVVLALLALGQQQIPR